MFQKYYEDISNNHQMTFHWVQALADKLNFDSISGNLEVATNFAHILCGLFALIYICIIVWRSWANGGQIDLYKCIKPFAVGMAIMFFPTIVGFVDVVCNGLGKVSQEFSDMCSEDSRNQFDQFANALIFTDNIEEEGKKTLDEQAKHNASQSQIVKVLQEQTKNEKLPEEQKETKSWRQKIAEIPSYIRELPGNIYRYFWEEIINGVSTLAALVASIISCCILCMGFIGRCIFYFIGPVLFAMELIPGMEGKIAGWFKKYIMYSLYPIIINMMNGVLMMLMITITNGFVGGSAGAIALPVACLVHVIVAVIGAFMFMNVPSVAAQVMDTATNGLGAAGMVPITYVAGKTGDSIATKVGPGVGAILSGGATKMASMAKNVANTISRIGASDSNYKGGGKK